MADKSSNKASRSSSKHSDKDKTLDGERRDHADDQRSKLKGGDSRPKDSQKRKGDGPSTKRHDSPDRNAGGKSVARGHAAVEPASASRQDGGRSEAPETLGYEGRDYSHTLVINMLTATDRVAVAACLILAPIPARKRPVASHVTRAKKRKKKAMESRKPKHHKHRHSDRHRRSHKQQSPSSSESDSSSSEEYDSEYYERRRRPGRKRHKRILRMCDYNNNGGYGSPQESESSSTSSDSADPYDEFTDAVRASHHGHSVGSSDQATSDFQAALAHLQDFYDTGDKVGDDVNNSFTSVFNAFCQERKIDPVSASLNDSLIFLADIHNSGVGYSAVNTARSAVSSILSINNLPIGQHMLVKMFMKGVFNPRPALPKYTVTWDAGNMIHYLRTLSPVARLSLKLLSQKLAMLLLLLSGHRGQVLNLLDVRKMTLSFSRACFTIGDLTKNTKPGKHTSELAFLAYAPDRRLCVVTVLKHYLERTLDIRGSITNLFLTIKPPDTAASRDTLRR